MSSRRKTAWYVSAAAVVAIVGGGLAICDRIGWAMPWSAAHASEVAAVKEKHDADVESLRTVVERTDAKLDMLLQDRGLRYRPRGGRHGSDRANQE